MTESHWRHLRRHNYKCVFVFQYLLRLQQRVPRVLAGNNPAVPRHTHWRRKLPSYSMQQVNSVINCFDFLHGNWHIIWWSASSELFTNESSLFTHYVLRFMGNLFSYLKILFIILIISGQNPFILLGLDTPRAWTWSQENKVRVPDGLFF